jgi:protein SCO1/2
MLRIIRYAAWALILIATFVLSALVLGWWRVDGPGSQTGQDGGAVISGVPRIGGPFTLVTHKGRTVTEKDFLGKPALVFFGFTHCPDVCPTTLSEISMRLPKLGGDADRLQVLFITANPERDTPEVFADYLGSFDPRITGLSGTREQVDGAIRAFKVIAKKVPTPSGYNVDHTASVIMLNAKGQFRGMIDYHEQEEMALAKMRRLLAGAS